MKIVLSQIHIYIYINSYFFLLVCPSVCVFFPKKKRGVKNKVQRYEEKKGEMGRKEEKKGGKGMGEEERIE